MTGQLALKVNTDKPENENRWYIVRKVITKRSWFRSDKVEWIPLTCSEVGYPRHGIHKPTDIAYFYDDFCASAAILPLSD